MTPFLGPTSEINLFYFTILLYRLQYIDNIQDQNNVNYQGKFFLFKFNNTHFWCEYQHKDESVSELAPRKGGQKGLIRVQTLPVECSDDVKYTANQGLHSYCAAEEATFFKLYCSVSCCQTQVQSKEQYKHLTYHINLI